MIKNFVVTSVYILILPLINRFLHGVIGTTNRPFVSHVRNDEVLWDNNYNNKLAALALTNYTEPRTRNQEQRRVSASLKLAVFILITDN